MGSRRDHEGVGAGEARLSHCTTRVVGRTFTGLWLADHHNFWTGIVRIRAAVLFFFLSLSLCFFWQPKSNHSSDVQFLFIFLFCYSTHLLFDFVSTFVLLFLVGSCCCSCCRCCFFCCCRRSYIRTHIYTRLHARTRIQTHTNTHTHTHTHTAHVPLCSEIVLDDQVVRRAATRFFSSKRWLTLWWAKCLRVWGRVDEPRCLTCRVSHGESHVFTVRNAMWLAVAAAVWHRSLPIMWSAPSSCVESCDCCCRCTSGC